jgi:hypothetical protein
MVIRSLVIGLAVLVAASLSAPYVQADTLPAIAGHAWQNPNRPPEERNQDQGCFNTPLGQPNLEITVTSSVSNSCDEKKGG